MSHPSKAAGTRFEREVREYLAGIISDVRRLPPGGARDTGDLVIVSEGLHFVIEAKAEKRIALPRYLDEAGVEADNYADRYDVDRDRVVPLVVVKRRNAPVSRSYVVTTLDQWTRP